jgi:hypothetical protein
MKWFALQTAGAVFAELTLLFFFEDPEGFAGNLNFMNLWTSLFSYNDSMN